MGSQNYSLSPHENSVAIDVNVAKTRITAMFQLDGTSSGWWHCFYCRRRILEQSTGWNFWPY